MVSFCPHFSCGSPVFFFFPLCPSLTVSTVSVLHLMNAAEVTNLMMSQVVVLQDGSTLETKDKTELLFSFIRVHLACLLIC